MCVHYDKVMETLYQLLSILFLVCCFHLLALPNIIPNHYNCSQNTSTLIKILIQVFWITAYLCQIQFENIWNIPKMIPNVEIDLKSF